MNNSMEKINKKIARLEEEAAKGYPVACNEDIARRHEAKQRLVKRFLDEVIGVKELAEYAELNGTTIKLVGIKELEKIEEESDFATVEVNSEFTRAVNVANFFKSKRLYIYIAPLDAIYKK